jgi:hypothetical protein
MRCETVIANFHSYLEQPLEWTCVVKSLSEHLQLCHYCRKDCYKLLSTFPSDLNIASKLNQVEWQELKHLINQSHELEEESKKTLLSTPTNEKTFKNIGLNYRFFSKSIAALVVIFITTAVSLFYENFQLRKFDGTLKTDQQISKTATTNNNIYSKVSSPNSLESIFAKEPKETSKLVSKKPCKIKLPAKNKCQKQPAVASKTKPTNKIIEQNPQPTFFDTAYSLNFFFVIKQQTNKVKVDLE